MQFLEKPGKIYGKRDISNLHQQNKKKLFGTRAKLSYNKFFSENLLALEMKKIKLFMNKPVYLGPWILEISKIVMYMV